ncbi:beta-L-arabinofuranosidase domain-containing protein [Maribacter sp. ACAM166]|uniref:beta-L-arabinofuranosidase domain-containing protein n=1 Tax=Maribacter sp. ACAM166 TaxID=2508996 RepID=UPI0010FE82ED|nr:beta-L-arabinofuranosidase domain-containing protein [Maribacter sp. ACAM166]TLP74017.1 hypothetical protein ES765_16910 [Maribacter sp. ACAM166]
MKINKLFTDVILCYCCFGIVSIAAQDGDQILDGIGETDLIARYVFDGDVKDWSRNNLHANTHESKVEYLVDPKFGKVLSLPEDANAYVSIPVETLSGEESISISGWINMRSKQSGQLFFDFRNSPNSHFFVAPLGTANIMRFQAEITTQSGSVYRADSPALEAGKWNHVAFVVDVSSRAVSIYVNGSVVNDTQNVELEQLFYNGTGQKNSFYIGKSFLPDQPYLNGMLHDFRIYRVPLNKEQITTIYKSVLNDAETVVVEKEKPADDLPVFSSNTPQLYNRYLTHVLDIEMETMLGHLPQLPRYLQGEYRDGFEGPMVRVLWPAPTDNGEVLKSGKFIITGSVAGTDIQPRAIIKVKDNSKYSTPNRKLEVFNLHEVLLNPDFYGQDTKFIENRDKFISTLAKTNPDSFLYMFRNAYGQEQPEGAEPLGVWDSQETKLRGHATGHYLTAIAQAYASTDYDKSLQANFADKMEVMVNTLYKLSQMSGKPQLQRGTFVSDPTSVSSGSDREDFDSDLSEKGIRTDYWNWGEGYISAYPPDQFIMLERGATYGGQNTQIWAPYYTLHKILAGLMDIYEVSGNQKALEVAKGMGSWVHARMKLLPTETFISMWDTYIAGEYGGMNESMARLSRLTNMPHYLETAKLFDNIKMFFGDSVHSHGLAKNVDTFRGLHANQHIPQIIGALETYRDSKIPEYYQVADNFWNKAVNDYMFSIGGVAGARNPTNAECFTSEPATLYENGFSSGGQNETCATYNMLKLTRNLFLYDQRGELMDYYERGLYNHIFASVADDSSANTYHVSLRPGSVKQFSNPDMKGFTCCNGTAIESNTKLQNSIYFRSADNSALYINLYVPSTLKWTERNVVIEQTTAFPYEDNTRLMIKGSGKFDINVRVPQWATEGFYVMINGKKENVQVRPGSYLTLRRKWKDGDTIELRMPFQFHLNPVMDQQNIVSLFYGPVLLAAQESEPRKGWRKITLDAFDIGKSILGNPKELVFNIDGVVFKPFYETYGRHSVYLDVTLK